MKILALDPAEKFGWAIGFSDGLGSDKPKCGTWDFKLKKDESYGMKLIRFRAKFIEMMETENVDMVAYERVTGIAPNAVISHSKWIAIIELYCVEKDIPTVGYSAKTVKKFATGNGNAKKLDMIKAAIKQLGYRGKNDNEADALWILEMAKNEFK